MYAVFNYVSLSGEKKTQSVLAETVEKLAFDEAYMMEIDLSPIKLCHNLTSLYLIGKQLRTLDLSPLASCQKLKILDICSNFLYEIDLEPLANCQKLEYLYLQGNPFQTIDLSPLSACKNLKELHIAYDQDGLREIDLSPLVPCKKLEVIALPEYDFYQMYWKNPLLEITALPVAMLPYLERIKEAHEDYLYYLAHPEEFE